MSPFFSKMTHMRSYIYATFSIMVFFFQVDTVCHVIYLGRVLPEITPNSSLIQTTEVSRLLHSFSRGN